jgi:15-cis-phytoene synthase
MDSFAHCEAVVRASDKDRFLATLFAPAEHRGALHALYAFNLEVARVPELVHEPLAGEIRLQWWSDVLAGPARGEAAANPVASALLAAIARYRLSREPLAALIEAHRLDLYDEPMATLTDLERYCESVASGIIASAARVLGGPDADIGALARHAGTAQAITGLLKAFPVHARRGEIFVPIEVLERHGTSVQEAAAGRATPGLRAALAEMRDRAREHLSEAALMLGRAPAAVMPALLPVAVTAPTLAVMERRGYDPFARFEIAPWRRPWLIWRAARRPARMFE